MAKSTNTTPNILVIYPDQMRADVMGCAGNPVIKTPHFDRLAREGVRFEHAYTSTPLCSPFRSSFFTGRHSHSTGVYANHYPMPTDHECLADILKTNGYQTGYIGKWHLNGGDAPGYVPPGPRRMGFDRLVGFNRGHYYFQGIYYRDTEQPYHCPRYEPDFQTDHLLEFMGASVRNSPDKPFFGFIAYGPPHFPMQMPGSFKELYRPEEMPLGITAGDVMLQREVTQQLKDKGFPAASGLWGMGDICSEDADDETAVRRYLAEYYGMIASIDHNVGNILDWLDKNGLHDNTIVILLSDHGDMASEHGYRCGTKKSPYRQAMQVPLIVRYPERFPAGHTVQSLVDVSVDTMPTLLKLCGIDTPDDVQGTSYLSLLDGDARSTRDAVFYEINRERKGPERFPIPERGVRTRDWLYVRTPDAPTLLFDLQNDPDEIHNLVDDERYRSQVDSLQAILEKHMQHTNDDWSAQAVFPPEGFLSHEEKTEKQRRLVEQAILEL